MSRRVTRHSDLVFNILRYATRLLAEGDESALIVMGFKPKQIRAMEGLTLKALQRISELSTHFLDFRIDEACLERVIERVEREAEDEALQDAFLHAGAPTSMMRQFWGMTTRDCAERRRVLGIQAPSGRPSHANDEALEHLWCLWRETQDMDDERRRYVELAHRSGLPLTMIWPVVEEWQRRGSRKEPQSTPLELRPEMRSSQRPECGHSGRVVSLHR